MRSVLERWSEVAPPKVRGLGVGESDAIESGIPLVTCLCGRIILDDFGDSSLSSVVPLVVGIGHVRNIDSNSVTRGESLPHQYLCVDYALFERSIKKQTFVVTISDAIARPTRRQRKIHTGGRVQEGHPDCEEIRIATGYFCLSGFDLFTDDFSNLRDPDHLDHAPFRVLVGRRTNREKPTKS